MIPPASACWPVFPTRNSKFRTTPTRRGSGIDGERNWHGEQHNLTEHQRELTDFSILSLQQHFDGFDIQNSLFSRYSSLYFTPDPVPDLLFTGLAQTASKSVWSSGVQSDASWYVSDAIPSALACK